MIFLICIFRVAYWPEHSRMWTDGGYTALALHPSPANFILPDLFCFRVHVKAHLAQYVRLYFIAWRLPAL